MKERLDVILVEQGYAPSREKAKAIIMSGNVYVNGQKEDKAGTGFDVSKIKLEVRDHTMKYVSRGGLKLEKAMEQWGFLLDGMICMDIGASTGGFTDCMLQNGATKVYSVDVGQGQLAWKLRNDERVVCMEQTNFRYVTPEDIPDALDFASVDVSFISLTKILIPARKLLKAGGQMVCLIKPQFEAGRGKVGKNGVVREPQIHALRDNLAAATGYDKTQQGGTSQSAKAGGFTAMTQDQGTKLEGMFTGGLQHWSSMDDRLESVVEKMDTAEGHLARIAENTGVSAGHLGELKEVIKKMIRDGLKVK